MCSEVSGAYSERIKTKFMVVGHGIEEEDTQISLEGGEIEHMSEFPYLGSSIAANGRIDDEIDRSIANASTFGTLSQDVFKDTNLSISTKRLLYQTCELSVPLYGECCIPWKKHQKRLNTFHDRCIRTILKGGSYTGNHRNLNTYM